jgi:hypothetical protein
MKGKPAGLMFLFGTLVIVSGLLSAETVMAVPSIVRGPYLQNGTPDAVTIRWRTNEATTSKLWYGTSLAALDQTATDSNLRINHRIRVSGLTPARRYYYQIGTTDETILAGGDANHFFVTSPNVGSTEPVRIWVLGDSGTANDDARSVKDAYLELAANEEQADIWLMLGDNAYDDGTDQQYQNAVFDMYPEILRNKVLWPTRGNHERTNASGSVYYNIFELPQGGEAGGLASGTEHYYSFDYANIHFVCLNSEETGLSQDPASAMYQWLEEDLADTEQQWIIAFWHHPPYTKGSHDSDDLGDGDGRLVFMRENALPILEAGGVDLVLAGHSHCYERSYFLNGHYDFSNTFNAGLHVVQAGGGRNDGGGAYQKFGNDGAVYVVAGSSGKTSGGPLNHRAMFLSANRLGSLVVDVDDDRLDARFLREITAPTQVDDYFAIIPFSLELVGPPNGATVDAGGAVLSCQALEGPARYQLVFGPDPQHMTYLVCDTPEPPTEIVTTFPFEQTWWTVRVHRPGRNSYAYANPRQIEAENVTPMLIENLTVGDTYDFIQQAIDGAVDGDEIVIGPGIWQHLENINFKGKNLTVRSADPQDPAVVAGTVINGGKFRPTVTFSNGERPACRLLGLTITDGNAGIVCLGAGPTVSNCSIVGNQGPGIEWRGTLGWRYVANFINCTVAGNDGTGILAQGRYSPKITNCLIAANKERGLDIAEDSTVTNCTITQNALSGIYCPSSTVINCIIWGNSFPQIAGEGFTTSVAYSNVQEYWPGPGNINIDPDFVWPGHWADVDDPNAVWVEGDYRLLPGSPSIDAGDNAGLPADTTDLDGDGNTTESIPWDLDQNERLVDGDNDSNEVVDMGAFESWPPIGALIKFTPQALNPDSKGNWVKAHIVLPEGFSIEDVDAGSPAMIIEPFRAGSEYINVFVNKDRLVEIETAFDRFAFCRHEVAERTVTVTAVLAGSNGQYFVGTDTIKIVNKTLQQLAQFALGWLRSDCAGPDWCDGLDVNEDAMVNLSDFASLESCQLEIVAP